MKKLLLLLLMCFTTIISNAQDKVITGTIISFEDNSPVPGVSVVIKGSSQGTITSPDGKYVLENVSENDTLVFSFIGYVTEEVPVKGKTTINVTLMYDIQSLDEIVAIGYGVQKKSLITGAISKVNAEELAQRQVRLETALQGKTAGVNIMQESGSPGGGVTVRIRGTGTNKDANPLFIVDGMRTGGIEFLNPNDIESIEILKDAASAAIYGAAAGNGVILITTKSGESGKSVVSYSANYGVQQANSYTQVLNAQQYATYYREGLRHEIESQYYGVEIPQELLDRAVDAAFPFNPDTLGTGTDWMSEIFSPASMQEHNVSISGGNDKSTFFLSGSYINQGGIVGGSKSNFDRISSRLNADHQVNDWMKVGANVSFTHFERKSIAENNEFGGVISNAMSLDPLTPVYFADTSEFPDSYLNQILDNIDNLENSSLYAGENGYYGMSELVQNEIANPVAQIANTHNLWTMDKVLGGADLTLEPLDGLTVVSRYSLDLAYGNNVYWNPAYYYHSINYNYLSSVFQSTERWMNWQWENFATYKRAFGKSNFSVMFGNSMLEQKYTLLSGLGEDMPVESWDYALVGSALIDSTRSAANSAFSMERIYSYYGRFDYNYDERYMFLFTLRYDASSKLSMDNRAQYFPSFSFGWVPTRESFWNFSPINFMKLRFSWGQNGNVGSLSPFEYTSLIESSSIPSYYTSGGTTLVGAEPVRLSNPNLMWETSVQTDVGIDIRLFNDRLSFTGDYYYKLTDGLITTMPVPAYVGNNKPNANAGSVLNQGVELELSYKGQVAGVEYEISANATYNENKVTSLSAPLYGANLGTTGAITMTEEGYPIWYFYGYEADGVFDSFDEINAYLNEDGDLIQPAAIPGDIRFVDQNGDGIINEDDKTFIGNPHPDWLLGFNADLSYRGFDLKVFIQGSIGNDVYFGAYRTDLNNNNKPYFLYENAWTPENYTDFPRYTVNDNNGNFSHNSAFVFDGSFVRLQNLELGYSFQSALLHKLHVNKLRLYVSGQNLFVITKYPGGDPEVGNSNYSTFGNSLGVDRGLYPRPRIVSFGLNLTL